MFQGSSKFFWKFCKPASLNKINFDNKIILSEKEKVVCKIEEIATHFKKYLRKNY